ncbi:hypothetical protein DFP73DRAFT_74313 [Morchella snyderi]|nr:hypothetical protein DFP73DRAFT_74313 [Morchella snyderi]
MIHGLLFFFLSFLTHIWNLVLKAVLVGGSLLFSFPLPFFNVMISLCLLWVNYDITLILNCGSL